MWLGVLIEAGIDTTAQQELFALGQHSREGYELANDIVGKLFKKRSDRTQLRSASAFVHNCVRGARRRLSEKDW